MSPTASASRHSATLRTTTLKQLARVVGERQHADDTHGTTARPTQSVVAAVARGAPSSNSATIGISTTVLPGSSCHRISTMPGGEQRGERAEPEPRAQHQRQAADDRGERRPSAVTSGPVVADQRVGERGSAAGPPPAATRRTVGLRRGGSSTAPLIVRPAAGPRWIPIRPCRRRSGRGDHQFQRPSSAISDGTSSVRTMNASTSTPVAVATPICWMNEIELVLKAPIATASRIAAAVTTRPGAGEADGDRLVVRQPAVARLLDPPEQEHAVVGREREHDRGGDEEVARLDAAVGRVAEQAGQVAALVDQHERRERGADGQRVHHAPP